MRWWASASDAREALAKVDDTQPATGVGIALLGLHAFGYEALMGLSRQTAVSVPKVRDVLGSTDVVDVAKAAGMALLSQYGAATPRYVSQRAADWKNDADDAAVDMVSTLVHKGVPWPLALERAAHGYGLPRGPAMSYVAKVSDKVVQPIVVADYADRALQDWASTVAEVEADAEPISKAVAMETFHYDTGAQQRQVTRDEEGKFAAAPGTAQPKPDTYQQLLERRRRKRRKAKRSSPGKAAAQQTVPDVIARPQRRQDPRRAQIQRQAPQQQQKTAVERFARTATPPKTETAMDKRTLWLDHGGVGQEISGVAWNSEYFDGLRNRSEKDVANLARSNMYSLEVPMYLWIKKDRASDILEVSGGFFHLGSLQQLAPDDVKIGYAVMDNMPASYDYDRSISSSITLKESLSAERDYGTPEDKPDDSDWVRINIPPREAWMSDETADQSRADLVDPDLVFQISPYVESYYSDYDTGDEMGGPENNPWQDPVALGAIQSAVDQRYASRGGKAPQVSEARTWTVMGRTPGPKGSQYNPYSEIDDDIIVSGPLSGKSYEWSPVQIVSFTKSSYPARPGNYHHFDESKVRRDDEGKFTNKPEVATRFKEPDIEARLAARRRRKRRKAKYGTTKPKATQTASAPVVATPQRTPDPRRAQIQRRRTAGEQLAHRAKIERNVKPSTTTPARPAFDFSKPTFTTVFDKDFAETINEYSGSALTEAGTAKIGGTSVDHYVLDAKAGLDMVGTLGNILGSETISGREAFEQMGGADSKEITSIIRGTYFDLSENGLVDDSALPSKRELLDAETRSGGLVLRTTDEYDVAAAVEAMYEQRYAPTDVIERDLGDGRTLLMPQVAAPLSLVRLTPEDQDAIYEALLGESDMRIHIAHTVLTPEQVEAGLGTTKASDRYLGHTGDQGVTVYDIWVER